MRLQRVRRLLAFVVVLVAVVVPAVWVVAESVTWNASLEANPTDSTVAATIDNVIRETRLAVRERTDAEHAWDNVDPADGVTEDVTQSGRHREGSARAFYRDAIPTTVLGVDADGSFALDDGRFWVETDPETTRTSADCCARLYVSDVTDTILLRGPVSALRSLDERQESGPL